MRKLLSQREYIELLIADLERRNEIQRTLLVQAQHERDRQLEHRLAILNDLRTEVVADRALLVTKVAFDNVVARVEQALPREYFERQHSVLDDKVDTNVAAIAELRRELSSMRSRAGGYAAAFAFALTVFTVVLVVMQMMGR